MPNLSAQNQGTGSANISANAQFAGTISQPQKKIPLILALLAIILLVVFFVFSKYFKGKPLFSQPAAKVGSQTITKAEAEKLAADCIISQKDAVEYLVDQKVLAKWSADEKVTISEKEASDEAVRIGGLTPKDCKKTLASVNLLRQRLSENLTKFREGKFIVINFGRYNLGPPYGQVKDPVEREKLRKEEQAYADQLLNSFYPELKAGKITFDEAMKKVEEDPRVGLKSWYSSTLQSGPFTAFDYINKRGLLALPEVTEKVDALKVGEYSEPVVLKIGLSLTDPSAGTIDERYVIAKAERLGKGYSGTKEQLLEETRKQYKAQIYI